MKQKKSYELLLIISQKEKNIIQSKLAFDEFYVRYKKILHPICRNICKTFGESKKYAMDLCHDVLLIVHDKAEKFDTKLYPNEKKLETGLKAWLAKIAFNEMLQKKRKNIKAIPVADWDKSESLQKKTIETQSIDEFYGRNENVTVSLRRKFIEDFLNELPERDADILMTYFKREKYAESSDLDRLSWDYNITRNNIRKIVERLRKKALDRYNGLC